MILVAKGSRRLREFGPSYGLEPGKGPVWPIFDLIGTGVFITG